MKHGLGNEEMFGAVDAARQSRKKKEVGEFQPRNMRKTRTGKRGRDFTRRRSSFAKATEDRGDAEETKGEFQLKTPGILP